jgi:hypothetical protein
MKGKVFYFYLNSDPYTEAIYREDSNKAIFNGRYNKVEGFY